MANNHYFYTKYSLSDLDLIVSDHQKVFNHSLEDLFSDDELLRYENLIDSIAAIYVQPILSDLSFDDFYADSVFESEQKSYFLECRSSICLENIPYLETNPFQVSYLLELLGLLPGILVDRGGVNELLFEKDYGRMLTRFKKMEDLVSQVTPRPIEVKTSKPVDPIDFYIRDVYFELERLRDQKISIDELSPKIQKIFHVMEMGHFDASELLKRVGLNPKELDDGLERLKFWLKKK